MMRQPHTWRRLVAIFLAGLLLSVVLSTTANAKTAGEFYRGKTITLVVGYAPGGGFDTLARLLAPRLEQRTGATVVVENHPGGGGLVALNRVYNDTPDGLTLMLVNGQAAALAQLLSLDGVRFDLLRIPWLGRVAADPGVVLVGGSAPHRSLDAMQKITHPIKWAAGGKADTMADSAACLSEALQLNARIIIGYKGSKEAALSVMRGETDAIVTSAGSARKYAKGGKLTPLAVLSRERCTLLPDVPTVFEEAFLGDQASWWIDFRAGIAEIGRALMTTPATPDDRVAFLRAATAQILTDPDFVADVEARGRQVAFAESVRLEKLLETTLRDLDEKQLTRVRAVILAKYYD